MKSENKNGNDKGEVVEMKEKKQIPEVETIEGLKEIIKTKDEKLEKQELVIQQMQNGLNLLKSTIIDQAIRVAKSGS